MENNKYKIDPAHSLMIFSSGHFKRFSGGMVYDPEINANCILEILIEAASISPEFQETLSLRSGEFPNIVFRSTEINSTQVFGDLTIHGITKTLRLNVEKAFNKQDHHALYLTRIIGEDFELEGDVDITMDLHFSRMM
jgi:polyisoprenoid-binding protein YceI